MNLTFRINTIYYKINHVSTVLLSIPLILSAFTHLFNPVGFPPLHPDEGHYMRRTMQVLKGMGPQESTKTYPHPYDHPYFGQLFLAAALGMVGYPPTHILSSSSSSFSHSTTTLVNHKLVNSIEMLYLVPRVLMGILAIIDTFLVYKIAERRYSRNVAVIASVLFAVMPSLLYTRWILLDSILMPLFLSSILFASYHYRKDSSKPDKYGGRSDNKTFIPILISGIFFGLAIFTKIPTFTMIPVVGLIIFTNNNRRRSLRVLGIWLIPVVLIPSIWPAYNISAGHFNEWRNGIVHQETRGIYYKGDKILSNALSEFFKVDPILFVLGICGLVYALIRKDIALLLWVVPYLVFLYMIGWTTYFHLLIIMPAFCISAAVLLENISQAIRRRRIIIITSQNVLLPLSLLSSPFAITSAIGIFGLISSIMLITANHTLHNFVIFAFITQHLPDFKNTTNDNNNKVIMIGSLYLRSQYWLYKYVFNKDFDLLPITDAPINDTHFTIPFKTQKVLFIVDPFFSQIDEEGPLKQINQLYNSTHTMAIFDRGSVKVRSNYS